MFTKKTASASGSATTDSKPGMGLLDKAMERPISLSAAAEPAKAESARAEPAKPATPAKAPAPHVPPAAAFYPQNFPKDQPMNQKPNSPNPAPAFRPDIARMDQARAEQARHADTSRFDMPQKRPEMGSTHGRPAEAQQAEMRKLIVGRDIALAGEISACDYLVVEGTVEARVREGRHIEIAESGLFRGTVEIDEADIAGRFEGDITVRGRLKVRATGRIDGKVQYGELEVEAGGHLEGEIRGLKKIASASAVEKTAAPAPVAKARPVAETRATESRAEAQASLTPQPQPVADKV